MLTIDEIKEQEFGLIRSLQGGRIEYFDADSFRWNPHVHGIVGLYNGDLWVPIMPSDNIYFENSHYDIDGSSLVGDKNYDVFARFYDYDTFTLELSAWSSNTARVVEPSRFEGVLVYDNTTASGKQMRYIGTVRTDSSINFADSLNQRFVVNWDNPIPKAVHSYNTSATDWDVGYGDTTWAEFRDGTSQVRGEFLSIHGAQCIGRAQSYLNGDNHWGWIGLGFNSTSTTSKSSTYRSYNNTRRSVSNLTYFTPVIGYNYITIVARSYASYNTYLYGGSDYTRAIAEIQV